MLTVGRPVTAILFVVLLALIRAVRCGTTQQSPSVGLILLDTSAIHITKMGLKPVSSSQSENCQQEKEKGVALPCDIIEEV